VKDAGSTIEKILQEKKLPIASPEQRVSTLSGALHIQLALIRMQHNQSPVVLIDDVFRYLVPDVWNCVGDAIIAIVDGTQALVIASRYPECLKSMDTILVMHSGHFIEGGPRDEVLKFPAHPISRILIWNLNSGGESAVSEPITTVQHSQINDFVALTPGHWVLSNSKNPRVQ
jgi:ABC-type glutathione transport system ATPase component